MLNFVINTSCKSVHIESFITYNFSRNSAFQFDAQYDLLLLSKLYVLHRLFFNYI